MIPLFVLEFWVVGVKVLVVCGKFLKRPIEMAEVLVVRGEILEQLTKSAEVLVFINSSTKQLTLFSCVARGGNFLHPHAFKIQRMHCLHILSSNLTSR